MRAAGEGTHEKTEPMRPPRRTISHRCGFDVGVYTSALVEETSESVWDRKPLGSEDSRYALHYEAALCAGRGERTLVNHSMIRGKSGSGMVNANGGVGHDVRRAQRMRQTYQRGPAPGTERRPVRRYPCLRGVWRRGELRGGLAPRLGEAQLIRLRRSEGGPQTRNRSGVMVGLSLRKAI